MENTPVIKSNKRRETQKIGGEPMISRGESEESGEFRYSKG
jgi:hypothetical protein